MGFKWELFGVDRVADIGDVGVDGVSSVSRMALAFD